MTRITEVKVQNYCENIIIGNGIMAKQLMFELKNHFSDITCISSLDFAPPSSLRTTAINSLRGAKRGVSSLGDMLVDSHEEFEAFYKKYNPPGVEETIEVQTWLEGGDSHSKWMRRYGSYELVKNLRFTKSKLAAPLACVEVQAYIIDPAIFYDWYEEQFKSIKFVNDFVVNITKQDSNYELVCKSGTKFKAKRLFLCTSYMSSQFLNLCSDETDKIELAKHKQVYGCYLSYKINEDIDYGLDLSKSFSLSYNFIRLIYRKDSNEFLLSLSDLNKNAFVANTDSSLNEYEQFIEYLNLKNMPAHSEWEMYQGIRAKGHKRIPFYGKVNDNLFICSGLYKNAFSFSYLFAKNILHDLKLT